MSNRNTKSIRIIVLTAIAALTLPAIATAGDAAAGKVVFDTNCMTCHGMTGKGDGPLSAALDPKPRDLSTGSFKFDTDGDGTPGSDADLKAVITQGAMAFGGSALMAPWPALGDADVANLIAYIRTLK
ncbi:MAG: cytochrome c [Myxococcota bacterium]|jgi:mono/diheme cytochrome c family protein|nr:cytochrome c [Myxococcota bacterium]